MKVIKAIVISTLCLGATAWADEPAAAPKPAEDKLKLSGYVQARYTYEQGDPDSSQFGVRRGRLKASYANEWSRYVLQVDATPSGVSLKDAEATFIEPWTGRKTSLTLGQTKLPFGFEAPQSSSAREFPERSRVVRALVSGERDRGAKINAKLGFLLLDVGVFNGNGVDKTSDNDRAKDVVGRVGVDFDWLKAGVSGWWGKTLELIPDTDGRYSPRNRVGADLQVKRQLIGLGSTEVRAEWITGQTWVRKGVEQFGDSATGWYATVVQGVGASTHVAFRYDHFAAKGVNAVDTFGLAVTHDLSKTLEVTGAFEVPVTAGAADPSDNIFTLQLQAKI